MIEAFKKYIISLMKDKGNSLFDNALKGVLWGLSQVYYIAVSYVAWTYKVGIRKVHKAGLPVVSVGNLTLGGTGKTPLVMFLADYLVSSGRRPAILTRGYGGDENRMLTDELAEVPVYVGQDRVRSAKEAKRKGAEILILDDGYQHRRLERDLNLLLLDSVSPFGNGCLFPRGILREPESAIERADMIVLTKTDRLSMNRRKDLVTHLSRMAPGKPIILSRHRPSFLSDVTDASYAAESICGKKVSLVSGIADPDYLSFMVEGLGATIVSRIDYIDHHSYSQSDINHIEESSRHHGSENIIITKKDYVKIKNLDIESIQDKLLILNITVEVLKGKEDLVAGLDSIISS